MENYKFVLYNPTIGGYLKFVPTTTAAGKAVAYGQAGSLTCAPCPLTPPHLPPLPLTSPPHSVHHSVHDAVILALAQTMKYLKALVLARQQSWPRPSNSSGSSSPRPGLSLISLLVPHKILKLNCGRHLVYIVSGLDQETDSLSHPGCMFSVYGLLLISGHLP